MLSRDKEARERWSETPSYKGGVLLAPIIAGLGKIGVTGFAAQLIGGISSLVIGVGLSLVAGMLFRPKVPEPSSGQIEFQQTVPPRTFVYGRMQISGPLGFYRTKDATSILHKIVLIHDGEVDAFETLIMDDNIVVLDESNYIKNYFIQDGTKRVQLFMYQGSDSQTADPLMITNFPGIWTTDHRLQGIAYALVLCHGANEEDFIGAYPNGEPQFKAVIRGRAVYDPRDVDSDPDDADTWLWSDNVALCILDWVTFHPKGFRIPRSRFDIDSFETLANICDELVPLSDGGSERRYRVATQVSLKEPRVDVLKRLREACDAHFYLTGDGLWAIRGGEWTEPTVTIDSSLGHIIEAQMSDGVNALSRYNELAIRYLSPDHDYAEAECDPWQDTTDPEFIDGKVITASLNLLQVPSFTQARRLAKQIIAYENPDWLAAVRANFYGLHTIGERNIIFNWSEPGEDFDGSFWLDPQMTILENGTGTDLSLRSADPDAYDWDEDTEEGVKPRILPPEDVEFTEGVPPDNADNFAVTPGTRSAIVSWDVPDDVTFYIARVWRAPSSLGSSFDNAVEVSGPRYLPRLDGPGDPQTWMDTLPAGTYRYWLTAENAVGDRNPTPAGPVSVTIS